VLAVCLSGTKVWFVLWPSCLFACGQASLLLYSNCSVPGTISCHTDYSVVGSRLGRPFRRGIQDWSIKKKPQCCPISSSFGISYVFLVSSTQALLLLFEVATTGIPCKLK
jgi:hypothetical protein